jgi:hypothetical protein
VSHVTVSGVWEGKGKLLHVTVSVVWMDAATLFVPALIHSFTDLGRRPRSLLQHMRSLVGLPVMDLQHRQDTGRHTATCMQVLQHRQDTPRHWSTRAKIQRCHSWWQVLQHHLTYENAQLSFQQVLQHCSKCNSSACSVSACPHELVRFPAMQCPLVLANSVIRVRIWPRLKMHSRSCTINKR